MKRVCLLAAIAVMTLAAQQGCAGQTGGTSLVQDENRSERTLHVYGPGGPFGPMKECADIFSARTGTDVRVVRGTPPQWIEQAKQNGDLVFQGAEYMLKDFMQAYPSMVDESSVTGLYARAAAILVRKGNPKNIRTLVDLVKQGAKIMVVTQEKMEEVFGGVPGIQYNIVMPVLTGLQAEQTWKTMKELDAWITYESWHHVLRDETDLIEVQNNARVLRITPVATMKASKNAKSAKEFVNFLKSDEAHEVFQKWGWK
jgi:accessory colonization factor AcfC